MAKRKVKILMLGFDDNNLLGHVYETYKSLPEDFEKKLVVLRHLNGGNLYSKFKTNSFLGRFSYKLYIKFNGLKRFLQTRSRRFVDNNKLEYCFAGNEFGGISAKKILDECKEFKPDIISIHWVANFITSKTIRDLYELTNAQLCFFFVDEAHLTGGCHYPVECEKYKNGCHECPALIKGKQQVAEIQMRLKNIYLSNLPKIVVGSPYDCRKAKDSSIFREATFYPYVEVPRVVIKPLEEARKYFCLSKNEFVIMLGAASLNDKRKGLKYSVQAIKKFAKMHPDVCILAPGCNGLVLQKALNGIKVVNPGYIDINKLFMAFCASNCFLSTTIADSGPMMVNYSIATGTPVVSFNLGIAQDLVLHKQTGYTAKYKDVDDLFDGIEFIYKSDQSVLRQNCKSLMKHFSDMPKWYELLYSDYIANILH